MKKSKTADREPKHPIGVASTRTRVGQDVLRAWERRYGAVVPHRTPTGRRLYSDADLIRLGLLRRLVEAGRRISDIANSTNEELESLAAGDRRAMGSRVADGDSSMEIEPASFVEAAIEAVVRLRKGELEKVLSDAALSLSAPELRRELIVPLLREVGRRWRSGHARIVHEHLASTIVRRFMERSRDQRGKEPRPKMIVTTPAGQRHELGAIMAATAAEEIGWEAIYLGPDLPAEEIAVAARELGVRAVALSLSYKGDDRVLVDELKSIRQSLDPEVALIAGGSASHSLGDMLVGLDLTLLDDFAEFQSQLETLFGLGVEE